MKKARKIIIALALVVAMLMSVTAISAFAEGEEAKITIYFQNNWLWSDVSCHYWCSESPSTGWPGVSMTKVDNDGTYDIYSVQIPADVIGIVINGVRDDGSGNLDQTPDITDGLVDGAGWCMVWDDAAQKNAVAPYHYNGTGGGAGGGAGSDVPVITEDTYIFFKNDAGWENVYYHAFNFAGGTEAEWPGLPMTMLEDGYYFAFISAEYSHVLFHNGAVDTAEFVQTSNQVVPSDGKTLYNNSTGTWSDAPDIEIPGAPEGSYGDTDGDTNQPGGQQQQQKQGFFARIWQGITNFFKSIGNFFKNIFGGKKK